MNALHVRAASVSSGTLNPASTFAVTHTVKEIEREKERQTERQRETGREREREREAVEDEGGGRARG